tara:strand:+ start:115 stop:720 length:606 start_codon:yes stop_codon:yes gene_type:complete
MQTYPLFASYMYTFQITENTDILKDNKETYNDLIVESGTASISHNVRVLEKYPKIKKIFLNKFKKIAKEEHGYDEEFVITTSWFTKTEKGQFSNMHLHTNSFYSGVYYYDEYTNDSSACRYESPLLAFPSYTLVPREYNLKNSFNWKIFPTKNLLVFFPSYIKHMVEPNREDVTRYSLAFNIVPKGPYGEGDSTYNSAWLK